MWTINFFETDKGKVPIVEFLDSIADQKLKAKVIRELELLAQFGNKLRLPHTRPITDERGTIFELRVKQSTNIIRIFFFYIKNNTIILTNGYIKKSRKASRYAVDLAFKYKNYYEKR